MEPRLPRPLSGAEATKISKIQTVAPDSNFRASAHSVCEEQYLLKQSVVLLTWLNPFKHKGCRNELFNSGYDQNGPNSYAFFKVNFLGLVPPFTVISTWLSLVLNWTPKPVASASLHTGTSPRDGSTSLD